MATKKKKSTKVKGKATTKKSLKQRLKEKKEELKKKGQRSIIFRQKDEGTLRVRILPVEGENEFVQEAMQFWMGKDGGSVLSPETFGEPCAIYEKFQELKDSSDEADMEIAKKLTPRNKYLMPVLVYEDQKGKKVDTQNTGKLMQITNGLYQEIIDLYLDEDEWGDMTDPIKGYDLKITREGKGKNDTNYTVQPCKNSKLPKEYRKEIDLVGMVKEEMDSYEETVKKLNSFMGSAFDDDEDDDEKPKKKKKKTKLKSKKKKKRGKDI